MNKTIIAPRSSLISSHPAIEMTIITDPVELARSRVAMEQFDRNSDWLQAHIPEVYSQHRGKSICVAGQELFVAESAKEAMAKARAVHPEEEGVLTRYIPKEKMSRIYGMSLTG